MTAEGLLSQVLLQVTQVVTVGHCCCRWFEADLIGFTTVRALHEAANGAGNKLNINFQKVEEDARRTRMTLQTSDRFAQNPEEVFRDNQAEEQVSRLTQKHSKAG